MAALLEVRNLCKYFNGLKAVDGVSFAIEQGRCFGLLGPNGAGKTTTVEILEGIKSPTNGEIRYRGQSLDRHFRDVAGIMFQHTALQDFITVRETLTLFSRLYPRTLPVQELVRSCRLEGFLDRDTRKLSGGQRQRLLLALALVNDPEIVFLDEPTTGLDPQARRNFWELVEQIKGQGKTVILTTHYMEEAYILCDEIIIMDHGRIIAQGSPKRLLAEHFDDVILQLPRGDFPVGEVDLPVTLLPEVVEISTCALTDTIRTLLERGISLDGMRVRERSLDDLFLELTGKELRP